MHLQIHLLTVEVIKYSFGAYLAIPNNHANDLSDDLLQGIGNGTKMRLRWFYGVTYGWSILPQHILPKMSALDRLPMLSYVL